MAWHLSLYKTKILNRTPYLKPKFKRLLIRLYGTGTENQEPTPGLTESKGTPWLRQSLIGEEGRLMSEFDENYKWTALGTNANHFRNESERKRMQGSCATVPYCRAAPFVEI
jgi:hypothetical protein